MPPFLTAAGVTNASALVPSLSLLMEAARDRVTLRLDRSFQRPHMRMCTVEHAWTCAHTQRHTHTHTHTHTHRGTHTHKTGNNSSNKNNNSVLP